MDKVEYAVKVLQDLRAEYEGVNVVFPNDLGDTPYKKPYITFLWSPTVDGEKFLLRFHLYFPEHFGTPHAKIIAPVVEFWHSSLYKKSWIFKNSIPHTYAIEGKSQTNNPDYPWVTTCWHYPGNNDDNAWKNWLNEEWHYGEGLNLTFETVCEWLRGYLGWLELGKWYYGGVRHKADNKRIQKDEQTFRRHNLSSTSPTALARGQTFQNPFYRWRWDQGNTSCWNFKGD